MATKAAAFNKWASSFGMPAYSSSSVPEGAELPYVTYDFGVAAYGQPAFSCAVSLWTGGSDADANARASEICGSLPCFAECDGGALLLTAGSPAWQSVAEEEPGVKRRYINVDIDNLTGTL